MARILAYASPALGHLFPLAPILLELQRRGHAVALRTLAAGVDHMREAGLDAAAIDERIETIALDDYRAKSPAGSIARSPGCPKYTATSGDPRSPSRPSSRAISRRTSSPGVA